MLATWLLRFLTCDGILLVCILAVPWVIQSALPNNRAVIEITAIVLPIAALFFRAVVGHRHIVSNNCSPSFRRFQAFVFCLAVIVFLFVDCISILFHVMPKPALGGGDYLLFTILIGSYIIPMAIATYPGPPKPLPEVLTF